MSLISCRLPVLPALPIFFKDVAQPAVLTRPEMGRTTPAFHGYVPVAADVRLLTGFGAGLLGWSSSRGCCWDRCFAGFSWKKTSMLCLRPVVHGRLGGFSPPWASHARVSG